MPVIPAVTMEINCATKTVAPKATSMPLKTKATDPRTPPMPTPRQPAAPTSSQNQGINSVEVTCECDIALVVRVLAWSPTLPEIALVSGRKPIKSW